MGQFGTRDSTLDVLKGIGIISMIMGHSNMGHFFEIYVAGFHMQLFFIVSGYLYHPEKYPKFFPYLKRKISTIIIPYFFFVIVTVIICEVTNGIRDQDVFKWCQYFQGVLWGNRAIFPITGAVWFLQSIFWIEIGYYFIEKIRSTVKVSIVIIILLSISIILSFHEIALPLSLDSALSGIIFYHIGYVLSKNALITKWKSFKKFHLVTWLIIFIINLLLIYINKPVNPRICEYSFFPLYYFNAVIGTGVWYAVALILDKKESFRLFKQVRIIVRYIGLNSIVFLGINQLIIKGLYLVLTLVMPVEFGVVRAGRNIIICFVTLVICSSVAWVINKTPLCIMIGRELKKG